MSNLDRLRKKIDETDQKLLELLSERGRAAQEIGKIKKSNGEVVHVPSREQEIYSRLSKLNRGPYSHESIRTIFREIISATRALEAPIKVSYLGPAATFTHMAAVHYFGSSAEFVKESGIQNVFAEVEKGHANYGVVPIENSTEGVISHTLDLFVDSELKICAEIVLRVRHHFLSFSEELSAVQKVYSHPHALAQCRNWILSHLPNVKLEEVESTAAAAERLSSEPLAAAIASEFAASRYGIPILEREIQDYNQNFTRFLVIGNDKPKKTGNDKTSVLFAAKDEVGVLHKILAPLAKAKINLTKIESRPVKKRAWEYVFFMDLDGHLEDKKITKALDSVKKRCSFFKILGSYPKSREIL